MRYHSVPLLDHRCQNESRADLAEAMLVAATDRQGEDHPAEVFSDLSDALAHFVHLCARAGIDFDDLVEHAHRAADGDLEDGPEALRDAHRFPGRHGDRHVEIKRSRLRLRAAQRALGEASGLRAQSSGDHGSQSDEHPQQQEEK